jgi:hypothetical protein
MATVAKVCYLPGVVKFEEALPATVSSVRAGRTETERGGEAVRVAADSTPDMCFSRSVLGVFHFVRERRQRKVSEVVGAVLCFQHTRSQSSVFFGLVVLRAVKNLFRSRRECCAGRLIRASPPIPVENH